MTKKEQSYSMEFKAEAIKRIADNNGNISATTNCLAIPDGTFVRGIGGKLPTARYKYALATKNTSF